MIRQLRWRRGLRRPPRGADGRIADTRLWRPPRRRTPGIVAAAIGLTSVSAAAIGSRAWTPPVEWVQPGPLCTAHQTAIGLRGKDRCVACHGDDRTASVGPSATLMTSACVTCHASTTGTATATDPHHRVFEGGSTAAVQCDDCHREHHGGDPPLTFLSDTRCQACHQRRYTGLADHPDWTVTPKPAAIAFDHASHRDRYFPAEDGRPFQCQSCHDGDESGEPVRVATYAAACAGCHDALLDVAAASPFTWAALPTADGEREPSLYTAEVASPDDRSAWIRALAGYGIGIDLPGPPPQWVHDIASRWGNAGQTETRTPPTNLPRSPRDLPADSTAGVDPPGLAGPDDADDPLVDGSLIDGSLTDDSLVDGSLIDPGSLILDDPPSTEHDLFDPLAATTPDDPPSFDIHRHLAGGGWSVDDVTEAIRYRPAGHADPILRRLIESLTTGSSGTELHRSPAVAACLTCHPRGGDGEWKHSEPFEPTLTFFRHGPHVGPTAGGCQNCHAIGGDGVVDTATRDRCVECHNASANTDRCGTCHRYHGTSPLVQPPVNSGASVRR